MNETIVEIKRVSKIFEDHYALEDISFRIDKGDLVAIIGPNGSGKTTLLKIITGQIEPTKGEVKVFDVNPKKIRKRIGYVPQRFDFDRSIPVTVREFMALERCGTKSHGHMNISKVLKEVGITNVDNKKLGNLSGGQLQRVMIARALLHQKEILIFDEPSAGIDVAGEQTIYDLIKDINESRGTTCVIVSHELNVLNKYANKVLCLNKKQICAGPPETVITPELLKELYGINAGLYHSHKHND